MKKILAILATLVLTVLLTGGPAEAVNQTNLTCQYSGGVNHVSNAYISTYSIGDPDRFGGTLNLNDGSGRTWNWRIEHNMSLSASGTRVGSFSIDRVFLNGPGTDYLHAVVDSAGGNVHCFGTVPW